MFPTLRTLSLFAPLTAFAFAAGGCADGGTSMEIDSDSTTANPSSFQRTIPDDAVPADEAGSTTID